MAAIRIGPLGWAATCAVLLTACQQKPAPWLRPAEAIPVGSGQASAGQVASVRLQLPARNPQRSLLAFEQSERLRVVFHGPDLDAPIVTLPASAFPSSVMTIPNVPVGDLRLVGLDWLGPDDKSLNASPQWALGSVKEGAANAMAVTPANQVAGEALASMLPVDKNSVAKLSAEALVALLRQAQAELKLADVRMVSPAAVAATLRQGGDLPASAPAAWGASALGQVAVRFTDWPPNMNVKLMVNDSLSSEVLMSQPDSVLMGPLLARTEPYQFRAVPLDIDALGNYVPASWSPNPINVSVQSAGLSRVNFSFANSTAGAPLPLRVAPLASGQVSVGGATELWLVGGLSAPASFDGVAAPPGANAPDLLPTYGKALRYRRASGWSEALTLPAGLPKLMTAVGFGSELYLFGGLDGQSASTKVYRLNAAATPPTLTAISAVMPVGLVAPAGGVVGERIFLAGGLRSDGSAYPGVLSFSPKTGVMAEEVSSGNPEPLVDAAGAGLDTNFYLMGGFNPLAGAAQPSTRAFAYDTVAKAFRTLKRMPTGRRGASALAHKGLIYVVGGDAMRSTPSEAVEAFDPNVRRWAIKAPLRTGRGRPGLALVPTLEGLPRLVVAGGGLGMTTAFGGEIPVAASAVEEMAP